MRVPLDVPVETAGTSKNPMRKFALLSFMIWLQGNHIAVDVPHDGIKLRAVPVEEEPQGLLLIIDGNDIALIAIILRIVLQLPAARIRHPAQNPRLLCRNPEGDSQPFGHHREKSERIPSPVLDQQGEHRVVQVPAHQRQAEHQRHRLQGRVCRPDLLLPLLQKRGWAVSH